MLLSDRGAFTVLLLIYPHCALTAVVPPPVNVSVNCKNLETTVSWSYDELQPQAVFIMEINGSEHHQVGVTHDLQYDLTPFVWHSYLHYLDFYYVTVTALQGGKASRPARSQTFTFNRMKMADTICKLDFPPVRVTADESGNTVIFQNPFIFYKELNESSKLESAFFKFTVSSDQGGCESHCTLKQTFCKCYLPSTEEAQACVTLRGWLDYGNGVENVEFRQTDRICATGGTQVLAPALTTTFILLFILTVILIIVCVLKGHKTKSIPKPSPTALDFMPHPTPCYHTVATEDVSSVTVEPRQVCCKNLEDQDVQHSVSGGGGESSSWGADGGADENSIKTFLYTDGALLENSGDQQQEAGDLMSSEHGSEEEEEEPMERSHYDRQHVRS